MVKFRIIIPDWHGQRIEGPWQRDVPLIILQMCKIWIERGVTFTVEIENAVQA